MASALATAGSSKGWSFSTGERGVNRVRAFTKDEGGLILLEFYERMLTTGTLERKRISLGTRDQAVAKAKAEEVAAALRKQETPSGEVLLGELFDIYLAEVTPTKGKSAQEHDVRALELFLQLVGRNRRPSTLSRRDWDRFINARRDGSLKPERSKAKAGVRNRVIEFDLKTVVAALNWAATAKDESGKLLVEKNPLKGFPYPAELNPVRQVFSKEQYEALWKASGCSNWRHRRAILITYHTGHRISAVRHLRWEHIDFEAGTIFWAKEYDKLGRDHVTPLPAELATMLKGCDRWGSEWVIPAYDLTQPLGRNNLQVYMNRLIQRIGLKSGDRYGWHSLRRQFATELYKDVPLPDLCALGGWKNSRTVETCYIKPDMESMRASLAKRKVG